MRDLRGSYATTEKLPVVVVPTATKAETSGWQKPLEVVAGATVTWAEISPFVT